MRTLIPLLAILAACGCAASSSSSRSDRTIDDGWRFVRQDVSGAQAVNFDDSRWQRIDLPHTWNAYDGEDGGDNYYRGGCWYRRSLKLDSRDAGKSIFLRFEGSATVTDVYVNGQHAGSHRGNFGAFCFDITNLLKPGETNVLAVRVDNSKSDDIPPLSGDFTVFGGLYRDVHLLVLDPLSISPLDDGSSGVYVKQTRVDDSSATVEITTKLRNATSEAKDASVVCTIRDGDNRIVTSTSIQQRVPATGTTDSIASLTIPHPHLWNGRADPYLYTVDVELRDGERVTDRVTQPLGLRSFRVDPNEGFMLNGRRYALHGVNRHQDRIDEGWAIGRAEHDEDFRLIAEMGCTGVRLSHYQQADYVYQLCDRLGLVVWAELPMVNDIGRTPAFAENATQQLRELIKQNYNHPSICFWSLYNEIALAKPDFAEEQKLVTELNRLAHDLDPARITTAATHKQKVDHPVHFIPDVIAFNRYWGWYQGMPNDWAKGLDDLHAALPGKRIGISEYGAGASIFQHAPNPIKPKTGGPWHPEEWQAIVHESAWRAIEARPWLWGTFIWNMFDFAADARAEGDQPGRNDKGLVTYDRKTKKDAFYFYKASWSDEPVVYITGRRMERRPIGAADVKVYSNCETVELFRDGDSLGRMHGDDHVFVWRGVELSEGKHELRAVGERGGHRYSDSCVLTASPPSSPPARAASTPSPATRE